MTRTRHPAVDAVTDLIRTRLEVVDTDNGPVRLHQPCLLAELEAGLTASSSGRGAGGKGAGTIPLNTAAWDLLVEIRYDTHAWAELLGVDPAHYAAADTPRPGKPATPPIGKLLRAVAVTAATTAQDRVADAIARCARRWAQQISDMLAEQPEQRDVRGARCPDCDQRVVHEVRDDPGSRRREDGLGWFTTPAIALVLPREQDEQPSLYCRACGWWATLGDALEVVAAAVARRIADRLEEAARQAATRSDDHVVDAAPGEAA